MMSQEIASRGNLNPTQARRHDYEDSVRPEASQLQWYAVRTMPRHEKRLQMDLKELGVECFLPLYEATHRWKNGCVKEVELPLFPGYIFVAIDARERFRVLRLNGAVSFVGSAGGPWPLSYEEIESLRTSMQQRRFEPYPYLAMGQKVRIRSGPLEGLVGFLVRNSGRLRVVVSIDLIGQSVVAEVDIDELEGIENNCTPLPL